MNLAVYYFIGSGRRQLAPPCRPATGTVASLQEVVTDNWLHCATGTVAITFSRWYIDSYFQEQKVACLYEGA